MSQMTDTQLDRSVSNLQGAEWPGPKLSRSGSTVEWPDLQQDCFGSNLQGAEWPDPQLSRSGSTYWEQNGQALSRIVLALIYREQNGQALN
jgi:hypothetical protein